MSNKAKSVLHSSPDDNWTPRPGFHWGEVFDPITGKRTHVLVRDGDDESPSTFLDDGRVFKKGSDYNHGKRR